MVEPRFGKKRRADQVWRKELDGSGEVVIASPYLTGPLARKIVDLYRSAPEKLTIYTRFDLFDFVSKASSIEFIKYLVGEFGCANVFEVEELHAKLVRARSFVTIGSQNVTQGSTCNLEASIVLREGELSEAVDAFLAELDAVKTPITLERCIEMEEHVRVLQPAWNEFKWALRRQERFRRELERAAGDAIRKQRQLEEAGAAVARKAAEDAERKKRDLEKAEAARRQAEEERKWKEAWRNDRIRESAKWLRSSPDVSLPKEIGIRFNVGRNELHREGNSNLLVWFFGTERKSLTDGKFYPIYYLSTGQFAYVRANDGHLRQFWRARFRKDEGFEVKSLPRTEPGNIRVKTALYGVTLEGWLGPNGLTVFNQQPERDNPNKTNLTIDLLKHFSWQPRRMGERLGEAVDEVFDIRGKRALLQVAMIEGEPLLVLDMR